ncbi:MAG TPA: hypothetical protein VN723_02430 [Rhizomicrobium sp.]|nr:hypothetical protein [Rhizomicrobium sp.]
MSEDISDRQFAERALARLPADPSSPRLEVALLATYDAWRAERGKGPWTALKAGLWEFGQAIWPGAPLWVPAAAFAASLLVGVLLGASLPPLSEREPQGFSLERTENFSLLTDAQQEDL